MAYVLD